MPPTDRISTLPSVVSHSLYTFPQLALRNNGSPTELARLLSEAGAVVHRGHVRLIDPMVQYELLHALTAFFDAHCTADDDAETSWKCAEQHFCPTVYPVSFVRVARKVYGTPDGAAFPGDTHAGDVEPSSVNVDATSDRDDATCVADLSVRSTLAAVSDSAADMQTTHKRPANHSRDGHMLRLLRARDTVVGLAGFIFYTSPYATCHSSDASSSRGTDCMDTNHVRSMPFDKFYPSWTSIVPDAFLRYLLPTSHKGLAECRKGSTKMEVSDGSSVAQAAQTVHGGAFTAGGNRAAVSREDHRSSNRGGGMKTVEEQEKYMELLAGRVICQRGDARNFINATVWWVPAYALGDNVASAVDHLFRLCPGKWSSVALKAYIEPLLSQHEVFERVITRYAKECRTYDGQVCYTSLK